jgi:Asp-tRNA(Asn)/Glu-tRNA(Gln) amidotransferase A subunit family amidase
VAAGLCYGAIGTDTAGSIRLPAAFCGITGFKPSYGLVSTRGVIPLSWSLDHVGPMARTAADAAIMLQAIASYDAGDIYSQRFPPVFYPSTIEESVSALRLGIAPEFWDDVDEETSSAVDAAASALAKLTAGSRKIKLSSEVDRTLVRCEAYAWHQQYWPEHEKEYDPETLRRIRSDSDVTAWQYIDAQRKLLRQRREVLQLFEEVDLIVTPTTPHLPPQIAELQSAPAQLRSRELVMLRNTRPFNVLGLPAVSVCCGFSKSGLPIGIQISGAPGCDGIVLALAHAYQKQTDWHKRRPVLN